MNEEVLEMSEKERDRLVLLSQVQKGHLSQVQAAVLLGITDRQVRNLLRKLENEGDKGVVSRRRGAPGNHHFCKNLKRRILSILKDKLLDFGPTLASEKLLEIWSIKVSKETIRLWMFEAGLRQAKVKKKKVHKPRLCRPCFGELIQADGSHHRWFGPDREMVNLTVFVDDATGMLTGLHFSKEETLVAYFATLKQHLIQYGRPRALYTDRSAVSQVRQGDSITQFHKALDKLGIELILANSPQAKGRVERANRTLQDRLLKELRLLGINNMEDANRYIPEFIEKYNRKFSRVPRSTVDAHRPLEGHDLSIILRQHEVRTLFASCVFQYRNSFFEVQGLAATRKNTGRKVDLYLDDDGGFRVFVDGVERTVVPCEALDKPTQPEIKSRKEVVSWQPKRQKPQNTHPWRRWNPRYLRTSNKRGGSQSRTK